MPKTSSDHWSDYWSRGCLTSLPEDFSANYDGEVAEFWNAAFHQVPENGSIIDLCTGNGAVAFLAADYAQRHAPGLRITAVDAATPNTAAVTRNFPALAPLLDRIRFIGNCRVEDLGLPGAQFDLATSQYGIEYCEWGPAAERVAHLLKPGGRLVMVAHTAGSDILRLMEREHQEYALLGRLGFYGAIREYLDRKIAHAEFRQRLTSVQQRLGPEFSKSGSPLFRSVLGMLAGALQMGRAGLERGRGHLQGYLDQTQAGRARLEDMLRVNRAIRGDDRWYRDIESAGLELQVSGEIRYRGRHHAGAFFEFAKPAGDG